MTGSDMQFLLTMFFTCMGCYAVLTTGFVFFARRLQRKGSLSAAGEDVLNALVQEVDYDV